MRGRLCELAVEFRRAGLAAEIAGGPGSPAGSFLDDGRFAGEFGRVVVDAPPINVLLVESDAADARSVEARLSAAPIARFSITRVSDVGAATTSLLAHRPDVILLSSRNGSGLEAMARLQHQAPSVPIILLTTKDDEAAALEAIRGGAQDYLVKGKVDDQTLAHGLFYAVQRKQAEEALAESEAFYHSLVESLPQCIFRKDLEGRFTFGNSRFCAEIGRTPRTTDRQDRCGFLPRGPRRQVPRRRSTRHPDRQDLRDGRRARHAPG